MGSDARRVPGHAVAATRAQRLHSRRRPWRIDQAVGGAVPGGVSIDADGKTTAFVTVRATPPIANWARLMCQVTDTTTNEIYQAQLRLNGGNYEAVVSGLRPNRAHQAVAWAVNSNNVDGAVAAPVSFTTANYTTAPSAPTGVV